MFEHSKEELTEFLQMKPVRSVLNQTRDLVFAELVTKLPIYAGRQVYARRKVDFLLEDIYVFAFSAVNGLPDQRLNKCLKLLLEIPDDEQEENDINDIQTGSTSKDQAGDTRQLQSPPQQLTVLSVISTEQQSPKERTI